MLSHTKFKQILLTAVSFTIAASVPRANAADPSFAATARPAGSAPASEPAPSPSIDTSGSASSAPPPGPASNIPPATVTNQALKQNVSRNANNFSDSDNSVQAFFDLAPINSNSKAIERRQTAGEEKSTGDFSLKKFLYHSMDNIGVPMWTGRTDSQLAPGLKRAYVDPPLPTLTKHGSEKEVQQLFSQEGAIAGGKPSLAPKIPLSELEGTGFDTIPDANLEIHRSLPQSNAKSN